MTLRQARQVKEKHREIWARYEKMKPAPKVRKSRGSKSAEYKPSNTQYELDLGF